MSQQASALPPEWQSRLRIMWAWMHNIRIQGAGVTFANNEQGMSVSVAATPQRVIQSVASPSPVVPVLVYKDGGSGGSSSAYPSWTYTIKTLGGVTIAATVAVKGYPRFIKAVFTQAPDGTVGYAVNNGGTWELGMVQEVNTQTNC